MRGLHVSWKNSQGVLLMGGSKNISAGSESNPEDVLSLSTTLLQPGGSYIEGFSLDKPVYGSCAIEDPKTDSVIITGGLQSTNASAGFLKVIL